MLLAYLLALTAVLFAFLWLPMRNREDYLLRRDLVKWVVIGGLGTVGASGWVLQSEPGSKLLESLMERFDGDTLVVPFEMNVVGGGAGRGGGLLGASKGSAVADSDPGTGDTLMMHTDWSTATGTSSAALFDTDKAIDWDSNTNDGVQDPISQYVRALSIDSWPTDNALCWDYDNTGQYGMNRVDGTWDAASVGEFVFIRFYMMFWGSGNWQLPHFVHYGSFPNGLSAQVASEDPPSGDSIRLLFGLEPLESNLSIYNHSPYIQDSTTYRIEWQLKRQHADSLQVIDVWINDVSGTEIAGIEDIDPAVGDNNWPRVLSADGDTWTTDFQLGNNGPAPSPTGSSTMCVGAWAVRISADSTARIGAYPVSGQEN